jgi:hypothetical protein
MQIVGWDREDSQGHVDSTNHLSVHTLTLCTICINKNRIQFHIYVFHSVLNSQ